MFHRKFSIRLLIFLIFLGIFLFSMLIRIFLSESRSEHSKMTLPSPVTLQEYLQMKANLSELQSTINRLLQKQQKSTTMTTMISTMELDRPPKHKLTQDIGLFAELVTVILYQDKEIPYSCLDLEAKQNHLRQNFPKLKILVVNGTKLLTVGFQFNSLISKVNTKYFFFLNTKHNLSDHKSDNSAGWLLHALENVPELDFVSGSLLNEDKLEIPCYRLKLCNWTLSQRYEYRKSIGELMICENIASSFMGRTSSVERIRSHKKRFLFDESIISLSTTDFFLTAKQAGCVCGVRPEVIFQVEDKKKCRASKTPSRRQDFLNLLPFAHKHKVFRFRHPDFDELDLCDRDSSPILGEDICDEAVAHKIMLNGGHWAHDGTFAYPFIIKNIQHCMHKVVDHLTLMKIPFEIEGGVALGAVKMREVLPWDAGDIDIFAYYDKNELSKIMKDFARKNDFTVETPVGQVISIFCVPPKIARKVGGLVSIQPLQDNEIPLFIKMKTNGRWLPYRKKLFSEFRKHYGINYLQHKLYYPQELIHCNKTGHNACLPDFRTKNGQDSKIGGTYKELFCDL